MRCGRQKGRTRLRAGLDRRGIQRPSHILKLDGHTNTKSVHILSHLRRPFRGVTACPPFSFKAGRKIGPETDPPLDLCYQPIKDFTHFFRLKISFLSVPPVPYILYLSLLLSLSLTLSFSYLPFSWSPYYSPISWSRAHLPFLRSLSLSHSPLCSILLFRDHVLRQKRARRGRPHVRDVRGVSPHAGSLFCHNTPADVPGWGVDDG